VSDLLLCRSRWMQAPAIRTLAEGEIVRGIAGARTRRLDWADGSIISPISGPIELARLC
jgi:hypothetical protein